MSWCRKESRKRWHNREKTEADRVLGRNTAMPNDIEIPARLRWARFRFGIVAPLLTVPPEHGELAAQLAELASRSWPHPTTGESMRLSVKTIERWLYIARNSAQALEALARRVPKHAGTHPAVSEAVGEIVKQLRLGHPRWTYQLVYDNLGAVAQERGDLGKLPSYQTVCRYMKQHGLLRAIKPRHEPSRGSKFHFRCWNCAYWGVMSPHACFCGAGWQDDSLCVT